MFSLFTVIAQNTYDRPTPRPNLPAPFSVPYRVWADQHPLNTSFAVVPGQILEPGVVYEPKIVFVPKRMEPNATDVSALRDPVPEQPAVTAPPKVVQPPVTLPPKPVQPLPPVTLPPMPAPQPTRQPIYNKPPTTQVTLLPLLPKQEPVRDLDYGRVTHPPIVFPVYPVTPAPTTRPITFPPAVLPTLPPVVPTRETPVFPPRFPPTQRPTGPFKNDFQCPESSGFYSVANSCEAYYECKGFVAERRFCPNGLYFNPAARYSEDYTPCAYPSEVHCTAGIVTPRPSLPQPTGQCPAASGLFGINDGDCSRYISCQEGLATIMNCPMGLVFNDQVQSCDWPEKVPQCTPNVLKDFSCPAPPVERNGELSEIVYNYRYGSQCRSFVACQKGRPRLLSCDAGLAFDEASQTCISEALVQNCATPYAAVPI